ncbi:MAG: PASTA domain-containing protein, partial [Nocardioides sp.]|nr:PASTA domain-containing protein [Nocardioides sp.]
LTGRPPFVGDSPVAVAYQHVREPAMAPSTHDTELTPEVDSIVMKALTKRLDQRYQSSAAMRSDIERYLAGRPVQAPAVAAAPGSETAYLPAAGAAPEDTSTGTTPVAGEDEEDAKSSRKGLWILLGILLVALIAAGAFFIPKLAGDDVEQVQVPRVAGQGERAATKALRDVELDADVEREASDTVAKGKVISTDPDADEFVDPGTTVTLLVSTGKPDLAVPNVVGMEESAARQALGDKGFNVIVEERDTDDPQGQVVEQRPSAETSVSYGSDVTIYVSDGPESVPDVIGMNEADAKKAIEKAGFTVKVVSSTDTKEKKGTVIDRPPARARPPTRATRSRSWSPTSRSRRKSRPRSRATPRPRPIRPIRASPPTRRRTRRRPTRRTRSSPRNHLGRRRGQARPRQRLSERRGELETTDSVVRRDRGLADPLHRPAHRDVWQRGLLTVGVEVGGVVDPLLHRVHVADRHDLVGLGVGNAMQLHGVAGALDPGRGDDALVLDHDRLRAGVPHRVHHRLDVLLVDDEQVDVLLRALPHLDRRIGEHHLQRVPLDLVEASGAGHA